MKVSKELSTCRKHLKDLTCHECAEIRLRAEVKRLRRVLRGIHKSVIERRVSMAPREVIFDGIAGACESALRRKGGGR